MHGWRILQGLLPQAVDARWAVRSGLLEAAGVKHFCPPRIVLHFECSILERRTAFARTIC